MNTSTSLGSTEQLAEQISDARFVRGIPDDQTMPITDPGDGTTPVTGDFTTVDVSGFLGLSQIRFSDHLIIQGRTIAVSGTLGGRSFNVRSTAH